VLDARQMLLQELPALAVRVGVADDLGDVRQLQRLAGDELMTDRMGDLAHDLQALIAEGQKIERGDHRPLERFSMGTRPTAARPSLTASMTSRMVGYGKGWRSPSGMLARSASSVNVPSGPKKAAWPLALEVKLLTS